MIRNTNVDDTTEVLPFAKPMLPAVYWLVVWIGCCIVLCLIFYMNIQHGKRVDKIFDDYYKAKSVLNGS